MGWANKFWRHRVVFACLAIVVAFGLSQRVSGEQTVAGDKKRVIGATATVRESTSGLEFRARVDTGAKSCSLHVEKLIVEDKDAKRTRNVGKAIRFQVKDSKGGLHWMEEKIAAAVRVKSSSLKPGEYDRRYKVRLPLEAEGVRKKVLVTLNDRTDMEFPVLLGRNFLRGDFVVDVDKTAEDGAKEIDERSLERDGGS